MESMVGMAPIRVKLGKVEGTRIDTGATPDSVAFDVDVSMDEESRTNDELTLTFNLTIRTKPSLVKFEVGGTAVVSGGAGGFRRRPRDGREVERPQGPPLRLPASVHVTLPHRSPARGPLCAAGCASFSLGVP